MSTTRICTTRVRSGCLTCKRRRKKCDEAKPVCGNCIVSKRRCEGYTDLFRNGMQVAHEIRRSKTSLGSLHMGSSAAEPDRRQLDAFHHLSSKILTHLDVDLLRSMLQRSWSRPAVWHSILALSVQLEAYAQGHRTFELDRSREIYLLRHHGQCLRHVQMFLKDGLGPGTQVDILMTTFLIIAFELLRGNDAAALAHLEGALSILHMVGLPIHRMSEDEAILEALRAIFTRLEVHALTFVGERVPTRSVSGPDIADYMVEGTQLSRRVDTTSQVRLLSDRFAVLEHRGHRAMRLDHARIEPTLMELRHWFSLFKSLAVCSTHDGINAESMDARIARHCRILHIRYMIIYMRLSNVREARETAFDAFQDFFVGIIQHAEAISERNDPTVFTMEMELIEPLYFTVLKCREPSMRKKALQLLRATGQEGVWDGPLMACIATHAVKVEEDLFATRASGDASLSKPPRLVADLMWEHRNGVEAEDARVHAVALLAYDRKQRTATIECFSNSGKRVVSCDGSNM